MVGLGISGIATAVRLRAAGWQPVIVERAPERRTGGYFIALFGAGRAAAERLGMLRHLRDRGTTVGAVDIDRRRRQRPGPSFGETLGRPWMLLRGDVEQAAFAELPADVEVRFSTVPEAIEQDDAGVTVTLRDTAAGTAATERFDLVVGADGVRSAVRALVFGPHERHLRRMNYLIAAYRYRGLPPGLAPGQGGAVVEPGRSATVVALGERDPSVMITYRAADVDAELARPPAESLRAAFGPARLGDFLDDLISNAGAAQELLFDSVEQVRLEAWHRGRVVLLGDAAWCMTLYASMGASAALAGAELLGDLLELHPGDPGAALPAWESALRPWLTELQRAGYTQRVLFVQETRRQILLRRAVTRLRSYPEGRDLIGRLGFAAGTSKDLDVVRAAVQAYAGGARA